MKLTGGRAVYDKGHDRRRRELECSACVQPSFSLFPGDGRAVRRRPRRAAGCGSHLGSNGKTNETSMTS